MQRPRRARGISNAWSAPLSVPTAPPRNRNEDHHDIVSFVLQDVHQPGRMMSVTRLPLHVVDARPHRPFAGNPAAVVPPRRGRCAAPRGERGDRAARLRDRDEFAQRHPLAVRPRQANDKRLKVWREVHAPVAACAAFCQARLNGSCPPRISAARKASAISTGPRTASAAAKRGLVPAPSNACGFPGTRTAYVQGAVPWQPGNWHAIGGLAPLPFGSDQGERGVRHTVAFQVRRTSMSGYRSCGVSRLASRRGALRRSLSEARRVPAARKGER